MELEDKDLSFNYRSHCDPRLNYEQSLGKSYTAYGGKPPFSDTARLCQTLRFWLPTTSRPSEEVPSPRMSC